MNLEIWRQKGQEELLTNQPSVPYLSSFKPGQRDLFANTPRTGGGSCYPGGTLGWELTDFSERQSGELEPLNNDYPSQEQQLVNQYFQDNSWYPNNIQGYMSEYPFLPGYEIQGVNIENRQFVEERFQDGDMEENQFDGTDLGDPQ